jgi:hypothetical protein
MGLRKESVELEKGKGRRGGEERAESRRQKAVKGSRVQELNYQETGIRKQESGNRNQVMAPASRALYAGLVPVSCFLFPVSFNL